MLKNVYRLEYLPAADRDIEEAENYLYAFSPAAMDKFIAAVKKQEETLLEFPLMYHVCEYDARYRCMPMLYEYLCLYRVDEAEKLITVCRVIRGMRDISSIL
jgi:plasmid stabilization system protein ParE